ncbi:MAG: sigma-70 family RNA polymerase sigma factor [Gammaproteobacteria bacterium]|nr:sigma-70 family RNA polymerase sigma factor [Gammaproteobacteria bacterium]
MDGDAGTPDTWVDDHGNALFSYALVRLRDKHQAEELVQETFLAALQSYERFSGRSSLRTWLIGILKHKILDQFRRDLREVALDDLHETEPGSDDIVDASFASDGHWGSSLADWGSPEQALENRQFWQILQDCLDRLPKRMARLFVLREVMEEGTEEICKDLAMTPTNLWTTLYRARLGLRRCLDKNWAGTALR